MSGPLAPALPGEEDYRRYDRIWRRVSPGLDPYPEVRAEQRQDPPPQASAAGGEACCMREGAKRQTETICAFLRDELADAQTYRALAQLAPSQEGRRLMRALAAAEEGHARTLRSVYFLITGGTYPVTVVLPPQPKLLWRERLRGRWHAETCAAAQYRRAAEGTADVCLKRIFERLSADEYRHAEQLRRLLEKSL